MALRLDVAAVVRLEDTGAWKKQGVVETVSSVDA